MAHEITLMPSGHRFTVDEATPLLTAGLAAGNLLPYSCRQGSCGTCRGHIVEGLVDYGDVMPAYLTAEGRAAGEVLLCQATARSNLTIEVGELAGLAGLKPRVIPCRVTEISRPSDETAILKVRLPMNENMRFAAGQYVDFILDDDARRSFSIASAPTTAGVTALEFHLKGIPGGRLTGRVFDTMKLREILRFEGPLGTFFLREGDRPIVLCVTGTGFAPAKSMLAAAFAAGVHDRRPIHLYWGARTLAGLYELDVVRAWQAKHPTFRFIPVLSGGADDRLPEARTGYVQDAVADDFADLSQHEVYACGSPDMIHALRAVAQSRCGLPEDRFFSDEFLPAAASAAAIPAA